MYSPNKSRKPADPSKEGEDWEVVTSKGPGGPGMYHYATMKSVEFSTGWPALNDKPRVGQDIGAC
jgi:hypothetical protein